MIEQQEKKHINLELGQEYEIPLLLFLEGLSFQDIAIKLNLSVDEVKKKIFTARKKLTK